jgi:ethanolamine utilization protein EutA
MKRAAGFFFKHRRSLEGEDEICLLSVGVDIGSSTSHLVFSRIVLERLDSRHVVTEREAFYQSDILLTPYASEDAIDADAFNDGGTPEFAAILRRRSFGASGRRCAGPRAPTTSRRP